MLRPEVILQDYLDRMGRAMLAGDFDGCRAGVQLPFRLETESGRLIVTTEEELRAGFDTFLSLLRNTMVTDYIRIVSEAEVLEPGRVRGSYTSHIMANSQRILPPHDSTMTLLRAGPQEDWRCCEIRSAIRANQWPIHKIDLGKAGGDGSSDTAPGGWKDPEE